MALQVRGERGALRDLAARAAKFAASAGVSPLFESVLLTSSIRGRLEATAADLERWGRFVLEGDAIEVIGSGSVVVPAKRLSAVLSAAEKGLLSLVADDRQLRVRGSSSDTKLQSLAVEDYPEPPPVPTSWAELPAASLRSAIDGTLYACSRERMRYALNGALVELAAGKLRMVATEGHRLASVQRAAAAAELHAERPVIIGREHLASLARDIPDEGNVRLGVTPTHSYVEWAGASVCGRLIEGTFPNYRDVIPALPGDGFTADREELAAAIARVALICTRDAHAVRVSPQDGAVEIFARSADGESTSSVPAEIHGRPAPIGLNPDFLLDMVGQGVGDRVTVRWKSPKVPAAMWSGDDVHVLMPVSLD